MLGCLSLAQSWASRTNRSSSCAADGTSARDVFSVSLRATLRFSWVSSASYTTPMPPRPSSRIREYFPSDFDPAAFLGSLPIGDRHRHDPRVDGFRISTPVGRPPLFHKRVRWGRLHDSGDSVLDGGRGSVPFSGGSQARRLLPAARGRGGL